VASAKALTGHRDGLTLLVSRWRVYGEECALPLLHALGGGVQRRAPALFLPCCSASAIAAALVLRAADPGGPHREAAAGLAGGQHVFNGHFRRETLAFVFSGA
jgi:hypothetical protein